MMLRTEPRDGDTKPCHIKAEPGDKLTLCGGNVRDGTDLPYLLAEFAVLHVIGHDPLFCAECANLALQSE